MGAILSVLITAIELASIASFMFVNPSMVAAFDVVTTIVNGLNVAKNVYNIFNNITETEPSGYGIAGEDFAQPIAGLYQMKVQV